MNTEQNYFEAKQKLEDIATQKRSLVSRLEEAQRLILELPAQIEQAEKELISANEAYVIIEAEYDRMKNVTSSTDT